MQISEVRKIIYNELKKKKSITAQILNYTPFNIPFIQSYGVLAHLVELGAVEKNDRIYTLIDEKKTLGIFNDKVPAKLKKERVNLLLNKSGRNTNQYVFEKVKRSKGRTVLAVVQAYVCDNKNVTYKQLLTVFPQQIIKRFGIINLLDLAKEISPDSKRLRYFFKDEDVINLKNQRVVVTNQWTHSAFLEFVILAKELGYVITPE